MTATKTPSEELLHNALEESGVTEFRVVPIEDCRPIWLAAEKFAGGKIDFPLWTRIGAIGHQRRDAYDRMCDFVGTSSVFLFLDGGESRFAWRFDSGEELRRLFAVLPEKQLYLTDENSSYLMCVNDHDYLIGVGACSCWLRALGDDLTLKELGSE